MLVVDIRVADSGLWLQYEDSFLQLRFEFEISLRRLCRADYRLAQALLIPFRSLLPFRLQPETQTIIFFFFFDVIIGFRFLRWWRLYPTYSAIVVIRLERIDLRVFFAGEKNLAGSQNAFHWVSIWFIPHLAELHASPLIVNLVSSPTKRSISSFLHSFLYLTPPPSDTLWNNAYQMVGLYRSMLIPMFLL